ncbi:hypothetical protein ASPSYDRAFT_47999 [Aspergillus sydowii CBS 593.65]|uniref:Peptidase M20 domain-containing protein 2 n=1 Tax=Aspergillus sydowii CBS 593.65 TaxID=1036612 RepID=A0A1L9TBC9_9EURO|nr:uncharacterized protein ASPSYDRAFT_47999 [Aspergillus sydowii CBS 593.65]OJJ56722.1 hypothetical protein ASPSYDRAFT_47999 [Aspergillus sydowii CBS 593.65]
MTGRSEWADVIAKGIDEKHDEIHSINHKIHSAPELAYKEFQAHENFVSLLKSLDFNVTPHAYGVETAFSADFGSGGRLLVFNAEYDALPNIGHACGHNLIASASLAGFLGVVAALKASGAPGRVRLLGTPAEEGGGGKLHLIDNGAYKDAAACLMTHPGPQYLLKDGVTGVAAVKMLANVKWRIVFTGRTAHAAMEPWNGANALDAVCLAYNAVSMLRQQIRPYQRIHGVFREAGDRPNIIPDRSVAEYYVRSDTLVSAERLWERVKKCFEGAAHATGCEVVFEQLNTYADLRSSMPICKAFVEAMPAGSVALDEPADFLAGSTDMGNVTYECPGFHGAFGINTAQGQGNHTRGFADASALESSFKTAMDWGKGVGVVGWRILTDDAFNEEARKAWVEDMKAAKQ